MNRPVPELRDVAARLDVPQPMRTRVLEELNADLQDMADELIARGVPTDEAWERALERLLPTPDTVDRLRVVHRSFYQRVVDRFSDPARHRFERILFGVALLLLAGLGAVALGNFDLLRDPAAATVPLLAAGLAVVGVTLWKLFQLHVRKDHEVARLRRGLVWLPVLAVSSAVGTLLGLSSELYAVSEHLADLYASTSPSAGGAAPGTEATLLSWLQRNAAMASIGLLVSALALGCWLWLAAGIARVTRAERELEASIEGRS